MLVICGGPWVIRKTMIWVIISYIHNVVVDVDSLPLTKQIKFICRSLTQKAMEVPRTKTM